jgi:beta-aspartyl-peptidase (threonine type)
MKVVVLSARKTILPSLFVVALFLCGALSSPVYAQSQSSEINLIQHLLTQQAHDWNNGDIAGYMRGYWNSDSLLFTSGGTFHRGWNATFEKYKKSYGTKSKMGALKFSNLEIRLLSSNSAWVFGSWELQREHDHPGGLFTLLLKKFPDGWKIIHDHTSSYPKSDSTTTSQ